MDLQSYLHLFDEIDQRENAFEVAQHFFLHFVPTDLPMINEGCRHHSNARTRQPFTEEEDDQLRNLVEQLGNNNWDAIALHMKYRTPRQCRERYYFMVPTARNTSDRMAEEDDFLLRLVHELGPDWPRVQRFFPERSAAQVKKQWLVIHRKELAAIPRLSVLIDDYLNDADEGDTENDDGEEELTESEAE